jgi:GNAT superfamily N-acetyltransferase
MRAKDFALEAKPLAPLEVPTPAQSTVEKSVKMANHIDKVLDQYEIKKSIIQQEIDRLKDQIESLKYGPPEGSTVIQKGRGWVGRDREGHPIGGGPVDEAFDRPYKLKWEKGEAGEDYDALVRLPDGSNLSIMFNEEGPGQYMVEFWRGAEQSVTGEGDAQRIFATVLAAIAKFIRQHQPQSIVFSAHKEDDPEQKSDSRSKLYNRLVQRYAGTMGYSYRSWDTGDSVQYELTRLKPGVAESSPNFNREWDEATRYPEFVNLGKKKWIELVSKGKPVTVTRKNVNKINNTDAADPNSFKLLDPEKQKRALAQLANGDVEMPIVARYSDGYLELIGGNTRLTAQMAKDGQAKVWLFNVPEELTQGVAEGLTEIENMPARNFDGERMLRLRIPAKRNLQPLLGGTDLLYAVDQAPGGDPRVVIVEPGVRAITKPQIVAVLQLEPVNYLPNTVQVGFITVDKDYRGRGLAKALYGIVFTKMRKNLLSGDTQTPGGKRNWMSLASIPGVEVKGMVRISNDIFDLNKNRVSSNYQKYIDQTMDQIMELGGQFFHKNKDFSFWLFDVVPGKGQLQPYVQNSLSKLYGYDARNLLLATWNRGTNESQQGVAEGLNFDEIYGKHLKVTDNNGDPRKPGFSLVTPLNGDSWNWRERPEFKDLVKQKLNDPGFLGDHKYQQIIASMSGKQFDPTKHIAKENFADGKVKGKSRPGRVKRAGASCNGSVTDLRQRAKNASGERAKMYHWCANMKGGKK